MEILSKIEKKLTSFYNNVVCKLEKTSQEDLLKGNKPLSWWRKITKKMRLLKILSIRHFKDAKKIKKLLSEKYKDENFELCTIKLILNDNRVKTWVFITKNNFWFILDNGYKTQVHFIKKEDFDCKIEEYITTPEFGKMFINKVPIPIVFDKSYTGNTETFKYFLDKNKI